MKWLRDHFYRISDSQNKWVVMVVLSLIIGLVSFLIQVASQRLITVLR